MGSGVPIKKFSVPVGCKYQCSVDRVGNGSHREDKSCYIAQNNLPVLRVPGVVLSRRFFATRGVLLVMKTLEDERYVVIKAYKCTVSEIWRDSFVLAYIACTSYPYIQSLPTL